MWEPFLRLTTDDPRRYFEFSFAFDCRRGTQSKIEGADHIILVVFTLQSHNLRCSSKRRQRIDSKHHLFFTMKHTLSYFGIMGRAEPIRLAFVQAGVSTNSTSDLCGR